MIYKAFELDETFEGDEPLYPPGWIPFLWAQDDDVYPQCDCPLQEGQLVTLLIDKRLDPGTALMANMLNKMDSPAPETNDPIPHIIHNMFCKKTYIRKVVIAQFTGLDQYGYPQFKILGPGYADSSYAAAWQPLEIPYVKDIIL